MSSMNCWNKMKMAAVAALVALAGCDSGTHGGTLDAGGGPLYVISTGIFSGDNFAGYLATVPSLDASTTFTLDKAVEIDPSYIFAKPGQPYVYAASLLAPTIIRYRVLDDGTLTEDTTVSFANFGVQSAYLAAAAPIYSDDKSYFVDDVQDQIVIWNPRLMQAIGTIPLHDQPEGMLPPSAEGTIIFHNGKLMTVVYWLDSSADPSQYGPKVRLLTIDPTTDTLVGSTDDSRITYAVPQAHGSDGTTYYSPGSFIAAEAVVGSGHGSPPLALRLTPTGTAFDPTYALDLGALVGGRPAGDFTLLDDQTALIRAWHSDLVDPVTAETWHDVLWSEAGFLWWRWHVGDAQAVPIPNQTPGALAGTIFSIDGKTYVTRTAADQVSTTLDQIDAQGDFHPTLTGPGQFIGNGVLRIR